MQIREGTEADIPEIISVLKASLGESRLPKTEDVWRYKHHLNPFGPSYIILALLDQKIIGVRAFMKWEWRKRDTVFSALRAVDTGVLPEYQGKGVFRTLNSAGLELAKRRGNHFIFNTPNDKSLPANLKMGWNKIDKLKICLLPRKFNIWGSDKAEEYKGTNNISAINFEKLLYEHEKTQSRGGKFFIPKSPEYLKWRYNHNPLQEYIVIESNDFYLSAYKKNHNSFSELRIAEHIFYNSNGHNKIKNSIKCISKRLKPDFITYSSELNLSPFQVSGKFGPILVYKNNNLDFGTEKGLGSLKNWSYTLGDLELF